jgi:transcription initiation factor TFIIIB Brf1 subunit/transcription initiation factor TFIIB
MNYLHECVFIEIENFRVCSHFNCSNVSVEVFQPNEEEPKEMEIECCDDCYVLELNGFYVCKNCGTVQSQEKIYDEDPYGFQNGEGNMYLRSSVSELYPNSSLGTSVYGNSRLAKMQGWNKMPYNERVIWEVSNDLKNRLSLQFSETVINQAIFEYKKLYNSMSISRGKNKKGLIASCVYFAARDKHTKITPKKLAEIMEIPVSVLNKSINVYIEHTDFNHLKISKAEDYAQDYCNKYNLDFKFQKLLKNMCNTVEDSDILSSCVPQNICLSLMLFILKEMQDSKLTVKQVSGDYNVSVNTISKLLEVLKQNKNYIFSRLK